MMLAEMRAHKLPHPLMLTEIKARKRPYFPLPTQHLFSFLQSPRYCVLEPSVRRCVLKPSVPQSQRDCVLQPRVARNELPWVGGRKPLNPERVPSQSLNTYLALARWSSDRDSRNCFNSFRRF